MKNYISYEILFSKLVDEYNNTYHHSIDKKPINNDYYASAENIESNTKAPKFKENNRVRFTKYENIFSKCYTENWSRGIFIIDSVLKTKPWNYKIKNLNGEKIKEVFVKKNCWGLYYKLFIIQNQAVIL